MKNLDLLEEKEEMLPAIVSPDEMIERNNHYTRNALTPALLSVEMLESHWEKMSPEQIERCLQRIKGAIARQVELLEEDNKNIAMGNVIVFRKRE